MCGGGEVEDSPGYREEELGGVEEHKSIILHLLSQLKLGMDLTKVCTGGGGGGTGRGDWEG